MNTLKRFVPTVAKKYYAAFKFIYELAPALRSFFKESTITPERAEDEIKRALEKRENNFLTVAKSQIYDRTDSPYLKLLQMAQCEYSDLETETRRHGIEVTLEKLAGEGVYITSEEFKGKQPIVRGPLSYRVSPQDFMSVGALPGINSQSSGTKNPPVHSFVTLEWLRTRAYVMSVFFSAHNLFNYCHGIYDSILPSAQGINALLIFSSIGKPAEHWFARWVPTKNRYDYSHLTTQMIVLTGKMFGANFPRPDFVNKTDIERNIVAWITEKKGQHRACCIKTSATNATRVAQTAWEMGISLEGTKFSVLASP